MFADTRRSDASAYRPTKNNGPKEDNGLAAMAGCRVVNKRQLLMCLLGGQFRRCRAINKPYSAHRIYIAHIYSEIVKIDGLYVTAIFYV